MKKKRLLTYRGELMDINMWEKQEVVRLLKGAPGTQYQEADDANKAIIRDWVRSLLQRQPITVTFVKADGTDRQMRCTLNSDFIPTRLETKNNFVAFSRAASVDGARYCEQTSQTQKRT